MIILDMEMPSNCDECRLKETDQYNGMSRCLVYKMDKPLASNKLYKENLIDNKKPEWCPIKAEIPDKEKRHVNACDMAIESLKMILDNATNGDVIKTMFNSYKWNEYKNDNGELILVDCDEDDLGTFSSTWWNAPYKSGK